jgi:hypothetical protein
MAGLQPQPELQLDFSWIFGLVSLLAE